MQSQRKRVCPDIHADDELRFHNYIRRFVFQWYVSFKQVVGAQTVKKVVLILRLKFSGYRASGSYSEHYLPRRTLISAEVVAL
jgi:hypothetical protein